MNIFDQDYLPEDLESHEVSDYVNMLDAFEANLISHNEGECWLPTSSEPITIGTFLGRKTMQQAAISLKGPLVDLNRRRYTVATMCPNPNCCNPDHLVLMTKKSNLDEQVRDIIGDDQVQWDNFRTTYYRLEKFRATRIEELNKAIARPGLAEAKLIKSIEDLARLQKGLDWVFKQATYKLLFGITETTPRIERFYNYLSAQQLLTAYGKISSDWKQIALQMVKAKHKRNELNHYQWIIEAIGRGSEDEEFNQEVIKTILMRESMNYEE